MASPPAARRPLYRARGGHTIEHLSPYRIGATACIAVTTFDDTSDDAEHPGLVTFSDGQAPRDWSDRTNDKCRDAVLWGLVRFFGPEAARPVAFAEKNWNDDPWSRGCYVGMAGPGTLTSCGEALREPCVRIHWFSSETATDWMGYMDGATRSGRRAADEVHARLQATIRA